MLLSAQDTEKDRPLSWQQTVHNYVGQLKQAMVENPQAAQSYLINRANIPYSLFGHFLWKSSMHPENKDFFVAYYLAAIIRNYVHTALGNYLGIPTIIMINIVQPSYNMIMTTKANRDIPALGQYNSSLKAKFLLCCIHITVFMLHTALPAILYHSSLFTLEKLHTLTASPDTMQLPADNKK